MAPEQAGGESVDFRSDLYSLACVLYEMLAGDPPYTGGTAYAIIARSTLGPVPQVRAVRDEVPEALEALITRNLSAERGDRSPSASAFAASLEDSLTAPSAPVYPPLPDRSGQGALERGRDAYRRRAWREAYDRLSAADHDTPLEPEDLQRLGITCSMLGRSTDTAAYMARAYQGFVGRREPERAARAAFWLVLELEERGEVAQASGWIGRVRRLLGDMRSDCAEQGFVLFPDAMQAVGEGDFEKAREVLERVAAIGDRFGDPDLVALTRHGLGRVLIRAGKVKEGLALLDEAMVAVTTDEVTPLVVGGVYCSVVSGCQEVFDWRRAQEWTAAMSRWCAPQPDLVLFRGQCLLRRSEVLQLRGDWDGALEEIRRALTRLQDPPDQVGLGNAYVPAGRAAPAAGFGWVKPRRRIGWRASTGSGCSRGWRCCGWRRGMPAAALVSLRRALEESPERRFRPMLLAACVEAAIAADDVPAARTAAEELAAIAAEDRGALSPRALGPGDRRGAPGRGRCPRGARRSCGSRSGSGRSWRRRTRRLAPGCSSGGPAASWGTGRRRR